MKNMTSKEIRARLVENINQQAEHNSRDFDAELKAVMMNGGNVDALEEAQLQAERQARRLRVEHQALESALPDAERAEAEQELNSIKASMEQQPNRIKELAEDMEPLVQQLKPMLNEIMAIQKARILSHKEASNVVRTKALPESTLEGTGQICCEKAQNLIDQLKTAITEGIDWNNQAEQMTYSTGAEYLTYKTHI